MPIPESLPGHRLLHDRALAALDLSQESQSVDYKESATWQTLEITIVKTALAMANLRDGGITIIGASERNGVWQLDGITDDHLRTFDSDTIVARIDTFASPHVEMELVTVAYTNGNRFLVVHAREFADIPIVCRRNGPPESGLVAGAVYVRPPGVPQTTRVMSAEQMHDLLEIAAEKQARRILRQGMRIGLVAPAEVADEFDQEIGEL